MGLIRFAAVSAVAVGLVMAGAGGASAAKKCVTAGGQGTGIGSELAKLMAGDALTETLSKAGMKGTGKVSMKCDANPIVTTCTASQKACK